MSKELRIKTVGDLREAIALCEDNEPLELVLAIPKAFSKTKFRYQRLDLRNAYSTAGGRAAGMAFIRTFTE
jgi:hypothetical protein